MIPQPSKMQARKQHNNHRTRSKILIADSEGVFRLGLKRLFSVEDDIRVVAQAEDSLQLLAMTRSFRPDVALVQQEIALTGRADLFHQIRQDYPNCKVVVTGSQLSEMESRKLVQSGVSGVIQRSARPEDFVKNVRMVIRGEKIQPARQEEETAAEPGSQCLRPVDTLTPREKTIISCLTQGWHNREIAEHLRITEQTVKNHLRSIYDKVGVSDRLELVLYAIHQRLELPSVNSSR